MRPLLLLLTLSGLAQAGEIDQDAALAALRQPAAVLIDVRTEQEFADGALPGAIRIGHEQIASHIAELAPDKDRSLVLYCRSGRRSSLAQEKLQAQGYSQVINAGAYDDLAPLLESAR
ncbi:rhodanese-like domain-containing protein [Pseudomonas sp. GOM7]|uniref:rhodanese-like domain-containing protein n=1 Tax=Pseudomonas sp. GOM7 TaxID=2998079 RepID=UPI00227D00C1|nr:rhodanese-like domain-containing protein [Pseudomonas sp. GOM7]WAJ35762.1 rhodanese-like domain-containing protein [Pseudomonas sp. GOM7]